MTPGDSHASGGWGDRFHWWHLHSDARMRCSGMELHSCGDGRLKGGANRLESCSSSLPPQLPLRSAAVATRKTSPW